MQQQRTSLFVAGCTCLTVLVLLIISVFQDRVIFSCLTVWGPAHRSPGLQLPELRGLGNRRQLNQYRKKQPFLVPRPPSKSRYNFTLTGVVFYGRRHRVKILNCYLERNLRSNGGILSDVIFVQATSSMEDERYLEQLIEQHPLEYKKVDPVPGLKGAYAGHYAWMDPGKLYVKIDDDVVFIADDAIELMVEEYLKGKYFLVSANVINHQPLVCAHEETGAVHLKVEETAESWQLKPGHYYKKGEECIQDWGNRCWGDWTCAAGQHYSFLERLREGTLDAYKTFPHNRTLWNYNQHWYIRWRINLIVFQGSALDVMRSFMWEVDDEDHITRLMPQQHKRHSVAVGPALAAHFAFFQQRPGLEGNTTLLQDYAAVARQYCGSILEPKDSPVL